jgi:hypothetical protein
MFDRQGWSIAWEYGRVGDSPQNARYLIRQRKWDESTQTFLNETTHEVGWIDTEGNLHTKVTRFSATENPDGTWTDTSTTEDIVIPQLRPNASTLQPETWNLPTWNLIETKNPAFEKTGILTLTYLDENGIPQTVTYNRELNFLQIPEISTDLLHPTPLPIEAVHSLAAHQLLILNYGDGEPFPTDNFPGWSLQFQYFPESDTSRAYLWPRSGETAKYIHFIGENNLNIPWFEIILPDGTAYPSAPVEIFNPQDPQNPTDGSQKLILFPALFTGTMTPHQRFLFQASYPNNKAFLELAGYQKLIILAQKGGYFTALYKINGGGWNKVGDRRPLDSLLGGEGNDVMGLGGHDGISYFPAIWVAVKNYGFGEGDKKIVEWDLKGASLPSELQEFVLVISP